MTHTPSPFGDYIQPFQIEGLGLRGRLVRLSDTFSSVITAHAYPDSASALLGETMTLATVLSSALKYEGIFTLQTQSNGPISMLMSDVTSQGDIRAYARIDEQALAEAEQKTGELIPRLLGAGHLAFTVDQGPNMDRYQGISELTGSTISECAQAYFTQSEQLETAILTVSSIEDGNPKAAGIMIQRLPASEEGSFDRDNEDEDWHRAVVLMSSITKQELLDPDLMPEDILFRLFHEDGVRMFEANPLQHKCRCSRQKVETTLRSFPANEILEMADEDGSLSVSCEFCKAEYKFVESDIIGTKTQASED